MRNHRESPLQEHEFEFPIQFGRGIKGDRFHEMFLQWGLIAKHSHVRIMESYMKAHNIEPDLLRTDFSYRGIGFHLNCRMDLLRQCIEAKSNLPLFESFQAKSDLRNPIYAQEKKDIFTFFGLDPDKNYYGNLMGQEKLEQRQNPLG